MYLCYYDESGDDGFPTFASPFFIFTAIYLHHLNWKELYQIIHDFRKGITKDYGLPVKIEMHTKNFLLAKNPFKQYAYSVQDRLEIISKFCRLIAKLNVKVINTCIVKPRIKKQDYKVLDKALTYSVQRIENDLRSNADERFMIITDPGRVGKMRKTTRRIQKINFIPSKFNPIPYRQEIAMLIEDPLPKDSNQSYYIQLSDLISYIVHLYSIKHLQIGDFSNRLKCVVDESVVLGWMEELKPALNLKASPDNKYGVVYYPK
jgi:hypothetical protein